jgi:hypothetical protein
MKRFSLAELRVADSDDDSDEFPSPTRDHQRELKSVATAPPGSLRQAQITQTHCSSLSPVADCGITISSASMPTTRVPSGPFVIQTDDHCVAFPSRVESSVDFVVVHGGNSGGDEMEGRRPQALEGSKPADVPVHEVESTTFEDVTASADPDTINPRGRSEVLGSFEGAEEAFQPCVVGGSSPPPAPPQEAMGAVAHRRDPVQTSPSPNVRLMSMTSPSIRIEGRHHHDPNGGDSDGESVEFVELASDAASQFREPSSAKACALVLDDGREVTPDSFASNSDENEDTMRPDVYVVRSEWDAIHTQRGESQTGRLTARSGSGSGVSLYRQRLIERKQAEQRMLQREIEEQWQDLTFRPDVNDQCVDVFHAQPYYVRLHGDAAKKKAYERRQKLSRRSLDRELHHPTLSEKTNELMSYCRGGDIVARLYPGKQRKSTPERKPVCGSKAVFARLAQPPTSSSVPDLPARQGCTFTPNITNVARALQSSVKVVDRLYRPKKSTQPITETRFTSSV